MLAGGRGALLEVGRDSRADPERRFLSGIDRWDLVVGVVAASGPLIHAARGGAFISDDWYLRRQRGSGWFDEPDRFFRPVQWLVHMVEYSAFGSRPWSLALVMAALGLVFAVAFRNTLMRVADPATATVAALIWAVMPSSSSLRFWPATAPILVSMILVAGAWYLALGDRVRPWQVTALVAVSVLTYESGLLIGLAAVGVALWRVAAPAGSAIAHTLVLALFAGWNLTLSPKDFERPLFDSVGDVHTALLGPGLTPEVLGPVWVVFLALPCVAVWGVVRSRVLGEHLGLALAGLVLAVVGIAIPVVVGMPLVPVGLLDRANSMAVPGVSLFLAAMATWLAVAWSRRVAFVALSTALVMFFVASFEVGSDVRQINSDVIAALDVIEALPDGSVVSLPDRSGYFVVNYGSQLDGVAETLGYRSRDIFIEGWYPDPASLDIEIHQRVMVSDTGAVEVELMG